MSIRFTKYVDIISGVGGDATVRARDLILRSFTTNPLLPTGTQAEFSSADEVGAYFGTTSEEYKRAAFYFGWISKIVTAAKKISFARWASAATAPLIYGNTETKLLATFTAINAGGFSLTLGGTTLAMTAIDLSGAADLAAVAALIQTKIRTGVGSNFTAATVTYDATRKSFLFTGGATGAAAIAVTDGAQTVADALGWIDGDGLILSNGVAVETITGVLAASVAASNNFGSFLFQPALSIDQVTEAAVWNAAKNVTYMFLQRVAAADASAWLTALEDYAGGGYTAASPSGLAVAEYPEMVPGIILAATDYYRRNSAQNYMYQVFDLTPSVTTDALSDTYDALRLNYYGETMNAGQSVEFYQRGFLTGNGNDPTDMGVYANEMWLKDNVGAAIMSLQLALPILSANKTGRSQLLATIKASGIDPALFNGTISVGKTLTTTQQLYITQITGDPDAWRQVQTIGYWIDVAIAPFTATSGQTEYKATYILVYSKNDSIRKVEGSHVLI